MDKHTSESEWPQLATASDEVERAARSAGEAEQEGTAVDERAKDDLLAVNASARKLARQLDMLSQRYDSGNVLEPSDVHVALDQAAAAAEDLATCTKAAARAIEDQS